MATITLDTITKQFDSTTAVDDVSLTINDGEVLGIVGPSGCGKTTPSRCTEALTHGNDHA